MSDDIEMQEVYAHTSRDANLIFLVNTVNTFDFEMGITIFVKGVVITGQLISGLKYHREMEASMDSAGPVGKAMAGYFRGVAENRYTPTKNEEDEFNEIPCNYMHLKNISMLGGNGNFNKFNEAFLRINLEEVDGHIIGSAS